MTTAVDPVSARPVGAHPASGVKSADLCWGQRYHWLRYQQVPPGARHDAHIVAHCPLPTGVTLADLRSTLNYLIRRHEALRTVFDAGTRPWPRQIIQPPAPVPIHVASTEADGTPTPASVVTALTETDFDLARDWPIRVCAVTTAGQPTRIVVVLNHVAFDDWSLTAFRGEFEELIAAAAARRRAQLTPVVDQPADLARVEAGLVPDLGYWRDELTRVPADAFALRRRDSRDAHSPAAAQSAAHSATLTSPALLEATRSLAADLNVWPSAVHVAAYAMAISAWTGLDQVALRWLTSHRDASGHGSVLTCQFSPTLVALDLSGNPSFPEIIARTSSRITQAQAHAYVPYDEIQELTAAEGVRRGRAIRVAADVNFLSYAPRSCAVRRDRFAWNASPRAWAQAGSDIYFRIHEWRDGVTLALLAADAVLPAPAVEAFLRGYLALVLSGERTDFGFDPPSAIPVSPPDTAATGPAETDLLDAVGGGDAQLCFVANQGRALRAPAIVAAMSERGWTGLTIDQLLSPMPLRSVAATLIRR